MAVAACLLVASSASARQVFNPADPAFAGAVAVTLPPAGMPPGVTEHEFQDSGVTFNFRATGSPPSQLEGFGGIQVFSFGGGGVVVTISPAVPAIAFVGQGIDGDPGGEFIGTLAHENIVVQTVLPVFYGAADIGLIGTVNLEAPNSVFVVTQMIFVPPGPPPPG
ncbi:MAG: hypothetical protein GY778_18240, partial [bacterium]|nr:hypothetical protein [bacterium]